MFFERDSDKDGKLLAEIIRAEKLKFPSVKIHFLGERNIVLNWKVPNSVLAFRTYHVE